ncbi:ATP-dependent DNA helicase, partial [Brachionus plicatilis]
YSSWEIKDINEMRNLDTACQRWNEFLKTASKDILDSVCFTNELSKQLQEARKEIDPIFEPENFQDKWMELAEIRPSNISEDADEIIGDKNYDFLSHRKNYTNEELQLIENDWITKQKVFSDEIDNEEELPDVNSNNLNTKQRLCYDMVNHYSNKQKQLNLIINGTAGTGKSYTIYALSKLLKNKVKRCAPTAKAAYLIKGETIHSLFEINGSSIKNKSIEIKSKKLRKLQEKFKGITHVIIDEYSMLSQAMFGLIDNRLRQATGKLEELFGGLSIILTGDPGQLLPVGGSPLYHY